MTTIFDASHQQWKVRLWMWIALLSAGPILLYGWHLYQSYGLRPADGGVLAPHEKRMGWLVGLSLAGIAFPAAMRLFGHCYVTRIDHDPKARALHIHTLSFLGGCVNIHPVESVTRSTFHWEMFNTPRAAKVRVPWGSVSVAGRRFPFIIDGQGLFHHPKLAQRLLTGG